MTSAAASNAASAHPSCSDDDNDSATSDASSEDSTTFWGSSISPPNISLMPSGWTSPRLFASSPASAPADVADHAADSQQDPSVLSSWGIPNPGFSWRLNSPNFFGSGSASSPRAEAADLAFDDDDDAERANSAVFPTSWHPSQWHIGSPHEYFFGPSNTAQHPPSATAAGVINPGHEDRVATTTLPSFPAGWHPSHWRLSSPAQLFSGDNDIENEPVDEGVGHTHSHTHHHSGSGVKIEEPVIISDNETEGGLWNLNIRPRFLTERFGSFSTTGGGVPLPWARSDEAKEDEGSGSSSGDEDGSSDGAEDQEGEEQEEEDELDLIGHR